MARHAFFSAAAVLVAALLLAPPAWAELELDGANVSGAVQVGGRSTWGDTDEAKFLEYRDLDEGAIGDFDFLAEDDEVRFFLEGRGENLGYDDQRYWVEGGRYNRYRFDLFYGELPHVLSTDARTPYVRQGGNTFLLPAGVQTNIAGQPDAAAQSAALRAVLDDARPIDLQFRWIEGRAGLEYKLSDEITLDASYRIQDKKGNRLFGIGFGSPGGNFINVPGPVDEQIHTVRSSAEYARDTWNFQLEYFGSFYDNEFDDVTADNPLSAMDAVGSAEQGRISLAPDNSAHNVTLSGGGVLPVGFPAFLAASIGYGIHLQDENFIDYTINSAFDPDPQTGFLVLPQQSLDGEVHIITGNVNATARPVDPLNLNFRYRVYRWDNRTDPIVFDEHIVNDTSLADEPVRSVANDFTRHDAELDAGYRLGPDVVAHLGYGLEYWRRSDDRQVRDLHEHGPHAKLDWRLGPRSQVQLSYRFRDRDGDDYNTCSYFDETLQPCGELEELRKFDQADRTLHDARGRYHMMPMDNVDFSVAGGFRRADYDADFGLAEQQGWDIGWDGYVQLHPRFGVGAHYVYEDVRYEMDSRWRTRSFAPPFTFVDSPLNNWDSDIQQRFHTGGVDFNFVVLPERLDLELGYLVHYGREKTNASDNPGLLAAPPPTTSGDGGNAVDWPEVEERLQAVTATVKLYVTEALTLKALYRFEDYHLDDFRREVDAFEPNSNINGSGTVSPSTDIFLSNQLDDYQAHILALTAIIRF